MTEKEVESILLNKLHFSQDSLYKLSIYCKEVIDYNQKFNLIAKSTIAYGTGIF
jgi:16S rRNA G527 N7-methylase RsmG